MGKLRDALLREAAEDEKKQLAELVGSTTDNQMVAAGSAFGRACDQSRSDAFRRSKLEAIRDLRNDPALLIVPARLQQFREHFSSLPPEVLESIIAEAKQG